MFDEQQNNQNNQEPLSESGINSNFSGGNDDNPKTEDIFSNAIPEKQDDLGAENYDSTQQQNSFNQRKSEEPIFPPSAPSSFSKEDSAPNFPKQEFVTPELAKKEIIEEADEGEKSQAESVHVMAKKFQEQNEKITSPKSKKRNILIYFLLIVLIFLIVGSVYYFWAKDYLFKAPILESPFEQKPQKTDDILENPSVVEEEILIPEIKVFPETTLKAELKTEDEKIVSKAEIYFPEDSINSDLIPKVEGILSNQEESTMDENYQIIGGIFSISFAKFKEDLPLEQEFLPVDEEPVEELIESGIVLNSPIILNLFYDQDLVQEDWENELVIAYFKDNFWTPLNSSLSVENDILSVELDLLPASKFAIVVEKSKIVPKIEKFQVAPSVSSSLDSDNDGLTDVEEIIYHTEINNPDSDGDGNPDSQEIINLSDPLKIEESKLAASGVVNVYTNPTYAYSFFYPSSWLARAIPETDNQEVLVITNTGEFFSSTVINNPEKLNPIAWYLQQSPQTEESSLYPSIINNQEAVWNPDHLTVYIAKEDKIYILSYNVGTEKQANFKATFQSLINSFQFIIQPQGRPDNTLIKYPDQPGVFLIQNGKKRPFSSGEVFEKLGFKWEDVIEIPFDEIYSEGPIIISNVSSVPSGE